jgi:hypothetical protein
LQDLLNESEENLKNPGIVEMRTGSRLNPADMRMPAMAVLFILRLSTEAEGHSPADVKQNLFYFSPAHTNGPDIYIMVC